MDTQNAPEQKPQTVAELSRHVADAHSLLTKLRAKLDEHPELDEAIERLEMALAVLTNRSGGLL
jgi:hypothetical protein